MHSLQCIYGVLQSYNCGHDEAVFEATARTVGMSAHKGIVYYSASGAWAPSSVSFLLLLYYCYYFTTFHCHCTIMLP